MPRAALYRANSVIYFNGDEAEKVFVLQRGKICLTYNDIETGKDIRETIQTGEFFGVKSALGKYRREENAAVLEDSSVLVFSVPEFEQFAGANTRIIIKMLKVFSNQLRRIHKQVENLMENPASVNAEMGLFKTGDYYLKNRMYSQARYVFSRYLTYYPAGKLAEQAAKYLEVAETSLARFGDGKGPAPMPGAPQAGTPAPIPHAIMKPAQGQELSDAAKDYYNSVSLFSQGKYKEALAGFTAISQGQDPEYSGKAQFDMGRCYLMLEQYDVVIKHYTQLVQSLPKHPDMADILLSIGTAYDRKGEGERAKGFYRKVLTMEGDDDSSARIKSKKALAALGGA